MIIKPCEIGIEALGKYAKIPIAFAVDSVLDVVEKNNNSGKFVLTERVIENPYIKNYDAIEGEQPSSWPKRFDVSHWAMFIAEKEGEHVGGLVVAFNTPDLTMLGGRNDLAIIWDIRVSAETRGQGVGSALFRAAEAWPADRGCRYLQVETQNINVAACRFYAAQECELSAANRHDYPELPDEIQITLDQGIVIKT